MIYYMITLLCCILTVVCDWFRSATCFICSVDSLHERIVQKKGNPTGYAFVFNCLLVFTTGLSRQII